MSKLNFYTVDFAYVIFLQKAEHSKRGFSRIPNMDYSNKDKPKFLCGVVLQVDNNDYYVPVTSFKQQRPDNFLIKADNGQVVSSLRFNYMFPIPNGLTTVRSIVDEPDRAYRSLLSQELRYCIKNQKIIQHHAERTYKRVLLGKDLGLVVNSCDFLFLEQKCLEYAASQEKLKEMFSMQKPEASLAIQILPSVAGDAEVVRIVDQVIEYIGTTGLNYVVGPFETTLEGDFDTLWQVAKNCQLICIKAGAPGLAAYMKMFYNPSAGVLSISEKVEKHQH